jgi:hypothetical protein
LDNLGTPGIDIRLAFGRIRDKVLKTTNNRQQPVVYGSIGDDTVSLVPAGADIAVIFYSGHAIEINGTNYILPVDAKLATDVPAPHYEFGSWLRDDAIELDRLIKSVHSAKRLSLVILVACLDNSFLKTVGRQRQAMRSKPRGGLSAPGDIGADTLIAYAASTIRLAIRVTKVRRPLWLEANGSILKTLDRALEIQLAQVREQLHALETGSPKHLSDGISVFHGIGELGDILVDGVANHQGGSSSWRTRRRDRDSWRDPWRIAH